MQTTSVKININIKVNLRLLINDANFIAIDKDICGVRLINLLYDCLSHSYLVIVSIKL